MDSCEGAWACTLACTSGLHAGMSDRGYSLLDEGWAEVPHDFALLPLVRQICGWLFQGPLISHHDCLFCWFDCYSSNELGVEGGLFFCPDPISFSSCPGWLHTYSPPSSAWPVSSSNSPFSSWSFWFRCASFSIWVFLFPSWLASHSLCFNGWEIMILLTGCLLLMMTCAHWGFPAVPLLIQIGLAFPNFHFGRHCLQGETLVVWMIILRLSLRVALSRCAGIYLRFILSSSGLLHWNLRMSARQRYASFLIPHSLTAHLDRIRWVMNPLLLRFWFWSLNILQGRLCRLFVGSRPRGIGTFCRVCPFRSWRWRLWSFLGGPDPWCDRSSWCTWLCRWSSSCCFRWAWGMSKCCNGYDLVVLFLCVLDLPLEIHLHLLVSDGQVLQLRA